MNKDKTSNDKKSKSSVPVRVGLDQGIIDNTKKLFSDLADVKPDSFEGYMNVLEDARDIVEHSVLFWHWKIGQSVTQMLNEPDTYGKKLVKNTAAHLKYSEQYIYQCQVFFDRTGGKVLETSEGKALEDDAGKKLVTDMSSAGVGYSSVREVCRLEDENIRKELFASLVNGDLTYKTVKNEVETLLKKESKPPAAKAEENAAAFFKVIGNALTTMHDRIASWNHRGEAMLDLLADEEKTKDKDYKAGEDCRAEAVKTIEFIRRALADLEKICTDKING